MEISKFPGAWAGIDEMAPIGNRHAACVNRLNRLLSSRQ